MKRLALLPFFFLALHAQPLQQVLPVPDCQFFFTLTAASTSLPSPGFDNRQQGCTTWNFSYTVTGFSAVSVVLQSAADNNGAPSSYATGFPVQQTIIAGTNPGTSTDAGFFWVQGINAWVRVFLTSKTGTGSVKGVVSGWRLPNASGTNSSLICPGTGGAANDVLVNSGTGGCTSTPVTIDPVTGAAIFPSTVTVGNTLLLGPYTIAASGHQLPAASTVPYGITMVSDGSTAADCTVGSGSNKVACWSNGTIWASAFSGSGSQTPWLSDINANGFGLSGATDLGIASYANALKIGGNIWTGSSPDHLDTFVGWQAGGFSHPNTGGENIGIGYVALAGITSGFENVAVGGGACLDCGTASDNVALGHHALRFNQTGSSNVAIGNYAMDLGTDMSGGSYNVGVGAYSLSLNQGDSNVALGYEAMINATTGTLNVAVGREAMFGVVTGSHDMAIGYQSQHNLTSGNNNVAVGDSAVYTNSTGNGNVGFGTQALYNTTGGSNMGLGYQAGFGNTSGINNVFLGEAAGTTNTTGSDNVAVGYGSNVGANNLTNATAIGYQASAPASNTIAMGNSSVTDLYSGSSSAAAKIHASYVLTPGVAFASLKSCTSSTNDSTHVPLGALVFCNDCKNVTDDTTGVYDAAAASGGHGTNVLCTGTTPGWRNH